MHFSGQHFVFCFFGLLTGILLFYYLYFFARLVFYRPRRAKTSPAPLTVIVCARNESCQLEQHLPELLHQEYKAPYSVLVVNDNSQDESKQILQWMARTEERLQVIHLESAAGIYTGKKHPLSIGILEAGTSQLLLTDADCRPASPRWAEKMQEGFTKGTEIVLGYGAYEKAPGLLNKIIRWETFHSALQYLSYALAGQAYMGVGRNISYTRELFKRHKGFTSISHIPGGDDDLFISKAATRTNTAIVIDKQAHTISEPEKTWRNWRRQKTRHYSTSKYYKLRHKFLLGMYSLAQFLFYPFALWAALIFDWKWILWVWAIKSVIQYLVFSRAMNRLDEQDLKKWIFFMDLWMFFYYLSFVNTLWKKEKKQW